MGEQVNTTWSVHTKKCYPALQRKKILLHAATGHHAKRNKPSTRDECAIHSTGTRWVKESKSERKRRQLGTDGWQEEERELMGREPRSCKMAKVLEICFVTM